MDFMTAMRVSSSGMTAQRTRMNTISSNIANVNTTRTPEGGPYRRKDAIFEAIPEQKTFGEILIDKGDRNLHRVQVSDIDVDTKAPLLKYEPDHPDANEDGYVAYPNINLMEEMANMIQATRSYEANISAFNSSKNMALDAIELGR
ncbi:MAG: flagellar basal body rod protein FlgC [Bdellovibrionota bacterium]